MAANIRWVLMALVVVVGCGGNPPELAGEAGDGDVVIDAGDGNAVLDAGDANIEEDAAADADADTDADVGDAAPPDGATPDAATADAAIPDAATPDAAIPDAATPALLVSSMGGYDFGTHIVPAAESFIVEIGNEGGSSSGALEISIEGDPVFQLGTGTCSNTLLAPGETCTIEVELEGTVPEDYAGSLEVSDGTLSLSVPLTALLVADENRALVKLVFERVAGATGRVTSTSRVVNEAFDCTTDCIRSLALGSEVTLTANGNQGFFLSAWEGGCESTSRTCTFIVEEPSTITVRLSPANRVFTSLLTYTMAEIKAAATDPTDEATKAKSGADAICRSLGGDSFQAWLGVPDKSPVAQRPLGVSGFVRMDQRPFANVFTAAMHTYFPPSLDQNGAEVPDLDWTWSGVDQDGTSDLNDTCQGWTTTTGGRADLSIVHARGANWPNSAYTGCGATQSLHLFCYETNRAVDVTPPAPPQGARRVFLGGGDFSASDGTGLAGADAICNQDAESAGLEGSFRAMLATNGASVASRFSTRGVPVYRSDGIVLAPDEATFFSPLTGSRAPLMTFASGERGPTFLYAWVGSETWTAPGQPADTCTNWSGSAGQGVRRSMNELPTSSFVGRSNCTFAAYLFCLEE